MVEQPVISQSPEVTPSQGDTCKHHWIIETPNGPTSTGICKLCGDDRSFVNYTISEIFPRRRFCSEQDLTRKQEESYYVEAGVIPGDIIRTNESILPKNGTIGGRL